MTFITAPDLRLTDHINGQFLLPETGETVPATDLSREILVFFQTIRSWSDFHRAEDADALQVFEMLVAKAMILPSDHSAKKPVFERPLQTMFDVPFRRVDDVSPGEIVFLGVPIDIGTTAFPGARFGPSALRMASVERYRCVLDFESCGMKAWNVPALGGAVLGGVRMSDLGDLIYMPGQPTQGYYDRVSEELGKIYEIGAFPVVLGGDHSITYATIPPELDLLVHLDAHCDLAELLPDHCHHHGNVLTRILAEKRVKSIHHLGLRDTSGWDVVNAGTYGKSVGDLEQPGWDEGLRGRASFISLDVDVLDPSVLGGTGTPVMGGLTLRQLCQLLARLAQHTNPRGLDVVELCPMRDTSGKSERAVIEAILCFLAVYHRRM